MWLLILDYLTTENIFPAFWMTNTKVHNTIQEIMDIQPPFVVLSKLFHIPRTLQYYLVHEATLAKCGVYQRLKELKLILKWQLLQRPPDNVISCCLHPTFIVQLNMYDEKANHYFYNWKTRRLQSMFNPRHFISTSMFYKFDLTTKLIEIRKSGLLGRVTFRVDSIKGIERTGEEFELMFPFHYDECYWLIYFKPKSKQVTIVSVTNPSSIRVVFQGEVSVKFTQLVTYVDEEQKKISLF